MLSSAVICVLTETTNPGGFQQMDKVYRSIDINLIFDGAEVIQRDFDLLKDDQLSGHTAGVGSQP